MGEKDTVALDTEAVEAGEQVIKTFLLGEDEPRGSQQILSDPFSEQYENGIAIKPPYNPAIWALMLEKNTRLRTCIDVLSRNTVGLGWDIVPLEEPSQDATDADKKEIELERERVSKLFDDPNDELPFNETMYLEALDEYSTGNGYIEVVRNLAGEIVGIWHVPSQTMRKRAPDGVGFVQIRGQQVRYFKEFNDDRVINSRTGETSTSALPVDLRATEILHFKRYSPRSSFYGIPPYASASMAVTGNYLSAERNVRFFDNDATPRCIITVSGGRLTAESLQELKEFTRKKLKGRENPHRMAVIQAEAQKIIGDVNNVKIDVHPLTVGTQDDSSFNDYREANNEEVRECFRIAKIVLGTTDDVNRASAAVSWETTIDQVLLPDIIAKEYRINHTIMRELAANKTWFQFVRPTSSDLSDLSQIHERYAKQGALTPNELRALSTIPGLEPIKGGLADRPMELVKLEMSLGMAPTEETSALVLGLIGLRNRIGKRYSPEEDNASYL